MADRDLGAPLDDAIDRAVREMMNADARPGFERRVMQRLRVPAARRFAWPRLAAACAALAAIVIAIVVLRDAPDRTIPPPSGAVAVTQPPTPAPQGPTEVVLEPSTAAADTRGPRGSRTTRSSGVVTTPRPADEALIPTVAALQPPTALAVESIQARPVDVPDIEMPSIEINELSVEPLPAAEGREE